MFLSRVWRVKPGREEEFLRLWREGVAEIARALPHATIRLWRDAQDSTRYHSVGGPATGEELDALRGSDAFRASMEAISEAIESVEVAAYELVEEVG
jgi:hypothetical protein